MSEQETLEHRSGMVALVGRPNVGKSTLMNALVGDKISIITPVAQTTRNQIRGIQNLSDAQIVYLDTPGIHHARKALNRYMNDVALHALNEVDIILYLVDASRPDPAILPSKKDKEAERNPGYKEDVFILEQLRKSSTPCFLVVNKVDRISEKRMLLPLIEHYAKGHSFTEVIPISAVTGEGLDALVKEVTHRLPEGPPLFPPEFSTDMAERFLVSEIIREKLILHTRHELPHSTAVLIESFDESERGDVDQVVAQAGAAGSLEALARELVTPPEEDFTEEEMAGGLLSDTASPQLSGTLPPELAEERASEDKEDMDSGSLQEEAGKPRQGLVHIHATVVVERSSQKGIVIGKRGAMLKMVGTEARLEIEKLLGCRVFLQLWVRVQKNWSKNEKALRQMGYRK